MRNGERGESKDTAELRDRFNHSILLHVSPSHLSAPSACSAVKRLKLGFEAIQEFLALLHGKQGPQSPVFDHPTAKHVSAERNSYKPFCKGYLARLTKKEVPQEIEAFDLNPGGGHPCIDHP